MKLLVFFQPVLKVFTNIHINKEKSAKQLCMPTDCAGQGLGQDQLARCHSPAGDLCTEHCTVVGTLLTADIFTGRATKELNLHRKTSKIKREKNSLVDNI